MFFVSVFSGLRTIIYTPLSIAFHAVSFVAKGIGYISSFGLIAGVYYLYQSFCSFKSGIPFGEIGENIKKNIPKAMHLNFKHIAFEI